MNNERTDANQVSALEQTRLINLARKLLESSLEVQTPFLMLDLDTVEARYRLLTEHLNAANVFYAVKANSNPSLLQHLADLGSGFDAASAGELYLLHSVLGISGERILFTHPTKDRDALVMIKQARPRAIVVDSISRLNDLLAAGIPEGGYRPELIVRIQAAGSNLNKFGQPLFIADADRPEDLNAARVRSTEVCDVLREAARTNRFSKLGVSFHVGTQCCDPHRYKMMLGVVRHTIYDVLASEGISVGVVDIGGGFSDSRTAVEKGVSQRKLLMRVDSYLRDPKYLPPGTEVYVEPGRFLVADAGAIVTEFIARTEFKGYELAVDMQRELGLLGDQEKLRQTVLRLEINDSLYNNLLPQIHDDREWEIVPFSRVNGEKALADELVRCVIFGHTCDGFDRLKRRQGYWLPRSLGEGMLGLFTCAGAYTRETAANFNGFAKSDVVTFREAGGEVLCRVNRAERPWAVQPPDGETLLSVPTVSCLA